MKRADPGSVVTIIVILVSASSSMVLRSETKNELTFKMTFERQKEIANSFSDKFEEIELDLKLSKNEFRTFENGIFSQSMDEKWNIFVINDYIYFARSCTNYCTYKVRFIRQKNSVLLNKAFVTANKTQYNYAEIRQAKVSLLRLVQVILDRDDIYVEPEFEINLIKETILIHDPNKECRKSIGYNDVGLTRQIHNAMTTEEQQKFYDVIGWSEVRKKIEDKKDDEPLISLHLHNKKTSSGITYYFDKDGKELLGQIVIQRK